MAASIGKTWRKYLLHFANDHLDFRTPELCSLASLFGIKTRLDQKHYSRENPFVLVDLQSEEDAKKIVSRSVLIRSVYELWAVAPSREELHEKLLQLPKQFLAPYTAANRTFRVKVDTFNKVLTFAEKLRRIEALPLNELDFQGNVNLTSPDNSFHLLEYYGEMSSKPPDEPLIVYFGRWIEDGQRDQIQKQNLKKRHFIGHTSMDACLSLLMSNMARVDNGHLVFDPFVGTGSLLVACAHHGAYVLGTDIDYLIIHGKGRASRHNQKNRGPDENIRANLRQYGRESQYLDAVLGDSSNHDLWRQQQLFDAIVTDPPYGIREAAKKTASDRRNEDTTENVKDCHHIPRSVNYDLSDIFKDLLNFASKFLKIGGRLVYWLPVFRQDYSAENVPSHPCLELLSNSEQPLNTKIGRRLITMEKVADYQAIDQSIGASVSKDHYTVSFRDRYFNIPNDNTNKNKDTQISSLSNNGVTQALETLDISSPVNSTDTSCDKT